MEDRLVPKILYGPLHSQRAGAETAKSWVLAASILGSSMAFIDGTVVNVALLALQFSLHASLPEMQWVVEAALLPFIFPMFLLSCWSGGLTEHFGAKLPLVIGPLIASLGVASGINNAVSRAADSE